MNKKIIIISVALIGFVLTLTSNSWAQRERAGKRYQNGGGHFQKWDRPAVQKFNRNRGPAHRPGGRHYRPVQRFKPKFHGRHHYRRPYRFGPKYRHPFPKRYFWRHHRRPVVNNYYGSTESYVAREDAFQASASVSDTGFSVSVGASKTN